MALKRKLTKDEYSKLSDLLKSEYVEDGDNYKLDVESDDDNGALKRAKDREVQLRKDAELRAREAEEKLLELEGNDAKKKGDIVTLEKSWKEQMAAQKADYKAKLDKMHAHTTKTLVDNVALSIATKISSAPALLLPHIRARLQADLEGDEPTTRVLDAAGKPSALTIEQLSNEFSTNKDYAAIILASKASGGAGNPRQSGNPVSGSGAAPSDLSKMNDRDLANYLTEQKALRGN